MPAQSKRSVISRLGEKIAVLAREQQAGALIIAFSGGPDSMLLFHATLAARDIILKRGSDAPQIILAHLDHALRDGSANEARAVKALAKKHRVTCELRRADVSALAKTHDASIEEEGHAQRYTFFADLRGVYEDAIVLTGHTLSDVAETVVVNLITGSGLRGAGGLSDIPEERVFRPMTRLTRDQVRRALTEAGISASEDPSNDDPRFLRNAVRLSAMPALERVRPGAEKTLARFAEIAGDDASLIEALVDTAYSTMLHPQYTSHHFLFPPDAAQVAVLDVSHLALIFPPTPDRSQVRPTRALMRHIIRAHVRTMNLPALRFDEADAAASVALDPRKRHVSAGGLEFLRARHRLLIFPTECRRATRPVIVAAPKSVRLSPSATLRLGKSTRVSEPTAIFDESLFPLTIRQPSASDVISLRKGRLRVSRILAAGGVPAEAQPMTRVVADKTGRIVWVIGHAAADDCTFGGLDAAPQGDFIASVKFKD